MHNRLHQLPRRLGAGARASSAVEDPVGRVVSHMKQLRLIYFCFLGAGARACSAVEDPDRRGLAYETAAAHF